MGSWRFGTVFSRTGQQAVLGFSVANATRDCLNETGTFAPAAGGSAPLFPPPPRFSS
jgi:hypothetical protein